MPAVSIAQCAAWAANTFACGLLIGSLGWVGAGYAALLMTVFLWLEDLVAGRAA